MIYRRLFHGEMHLRPWEVRRLTIPELELCLDDDVSGKRPPHGARPVADVGAAVERWRSMTREQKLAEARRVG